MDAGYAAAYEARIVITVTAMHMPQTLIMEKLCLSLMLKTLHSCNDKKVRRETLRKVHARLPTI